MSQPAERFLPRGRFEGWRDALSTALPPRIASADDAADEDDHVDADDDGGGVDADVHAADVDMLLLLMLMVLVLFGFGGWTELSGGGGGVILTCEAVQNVFELRRPFSSRRQGLNY